MKFSIYRAAASKYVGHLRRSADDRETLALVKRRGRFYVRARLAALAETGPVVVNEVTIDTKPQRMWIPGV